MGRVRQHYGRQITGGRGGVNRAGKTVLNQLGQQTAMVNVGVGKQYEINFGGIKGKRGIVVFFQLFIALKHTAINEKTAAFVFQQIT